ncbi:MAG TPA: glutathione S-transferase, partial [Rhodocyclaceae bacterium]|nr:glutathione S-transferase [Rhodocyclaceae bacterium]
MKLFVAPRAPNPRRVRMFIAEKGLDGITEVPVDLNSGAHKAADFRTRSPLAKVPVLELDDGRTLGETRAICTYLEGIAPEPNLMGRGFDERAFIEMADRRIELYLFGTIANCIRHTHPGLAPLEQPQ